MPADNDLRRGFTVFIRQLTNNFLIEYPSPPCASGLQDSVWILCVAFQA
jgi:hypothetical protein